MSRTFTITDDDGGRVVQDGQNVRTRTALLGSTGQRSFGASVTENGATTAVRVPYAVTPVTDTSRVRRIARSPGDRPNVVPQPFYDDGLAELVDPLAHPILGFAGGVAGAFEHTAVKDGPWSDPSVWSSGVVPGLTSASAGQSVSLGRFAVTLDVASDVILRDVFGPIGSKLTLSRTVETRLRLCTLMLMGMADLTDDAESATPGKARHEIIHHPVYAPGASAALGTMFMGPLRIRGARKVGRLRAAAPGGQTVAAIPAGATTITLPGLAASGWRVGDTVIVGGTSYVQPASTDPQYTGPAQYWDTGKNAMSYANSFQFGQDEERTVAAINGDVLTLSSALAHEHRGTTGTLRDGTVVTLAPVVANPTRSIRFRTASAAADGALDPNANLSALQKRAHLMAMRHGDVDLRWFECRDMGRTDTNPTLFVGGLPYRCDIAGGLLTVEALRATNGGALLADPLNVRGRYPIHLHWSGGPYQASPLVPLVGASAWAPRANPPIPGWAITQHGTRAAIEGCVVSNARGAGLVSELGLETGHWSGNTVLGCRGDGFGDHRWGDRAELYTNHNDSSGVAFGNQSRAILMHGNVASSCRYAYLWHAQKDARWRRSPRDVDVRLGDPLIKGAAGAAEHWEDEVLGPQQVQIPPMVDNEAWACRIGFAVIHRNGGNATMGPDRTPMLIEGFHAINCPRAWEVPEYSNTYYLRDCLFQAHPSAAVAGSVGILLGNVSWGWNVANCHLRNYETDVVDGGAGLNYEGFLIDVTREAGASGVSSAITTNAPYRTFAGARTHATKNVMGDWEDHPTDANQARIRRYRSMSRAELPSPYPLAPYGRKLPAGHPAVPVGGTPYFVIGDGTNGAGTTGLNLSLSAGGGRSQGALFGIIRDCVGDRRFPDWQSSETFPTNTSVKTSRNFGKMTPEQAVLRHGCWLDGATWKLRTWFRDADRFTHVRFAFAVDWTLNGFQTDFLLAHQIAGPPPAPEWPDKLERIPAVQPPMASPPAGHLQARSRTVLEVVSGEALAHRVRVNEVAVRRTIQGGVDAAHFAIANGSLVFTGAGTRAHATPQDANGDNAYEVIVRVSDTWGQFSDVPHTVKVLPSARASATIVDDFNRADENLTARPAYLMMTGAAGTFGVRSNRLAILTADTSAVADLGSLGSSQQEATATFPDWTSNALVLMRLEDAGNWIGFARRDFAPNAWVVQMCVGGVVTTLAELGNYGGGIAMNVRLDGRMMTVRWVGNGTNASFVLFPRNSASLARPAEPDASAGPGALLLPANAPMGHKVGLRGGGAALNPWIDNLSFARLPS